MLFGSLTEMSLPEVLRLLSASSQTGCLVLQDEALRAFFYFKIGQLSHCECITNIGQGPIKIKGVDAVSKICCYTKCSFKFDSQLYSEEESLLVYPTAKLIDSIGLFIEKKKIQHVDLPEEEAVLLFQAGKNLQNFKATQAELALLLLANGKRSIAEIATASNCAVRVVQDWAARFIAHGLLTDAHAIENAQEPSVPPETDCAQPPCAETKNKTVRYWRGKPISE